MKKPIPKFETEEQEADYWDNHSLLEHFDDDELLMEPLIVRRRKDKIIGIRIDGITQRKLDKMAQQYKTTPSTLARLLIIKGLDTHHSTENG
jgi:hypothetical protein